MCARYSITPNTSIMPALANYSSPTDWPDRELLSKAKTRLTRTNKANQDQPRLKKANRG